MAKSEVPTMLIEYAGKGDSGWYQGDIERDPGIRYKQKPRNSPGRVTIPNTGYMTEMVEEQRGGETVKVKKNIAIRYIKNCPTILVLEQEKLGYEPHKDKEVDLIPMYEGMGTITREGDVALYNYLEKVNYNGSNPNRSPTAGILFYVVDLEKEHEGVNDDLFIEARAVSYIELLTTKGGSKEKPVYKYQEEKIDGLCSLFGIFGESYSEKIQLLVNNAKSNPKNFLNLAKKYEETVVTEVTHALQLNVIRFQGNTVEYVSGEKVISTLGNGNLREPAKIAKFADLLRTPEYAGIYIEFKANLEAAQEKEFEKV